MKEHDEKYTLAQNQHLITWASHRETKLKIALRFFLCFCFPHSVTNRRLGLKTHAQVILSLHGFAWVGHFFSRRFSRFPKENTTFRSGTSKEEILRNTQQFR